MEIDDYDDLTKVKFKDETIQDNEIKSSTDHLLMKYFGNRLKNSHRPQTPVKTEPYIQGRKWSIWKPITLSAVIVVLIALSRWQKISQYLEFSSRDIINKAVLYGILFILVLVLITVTYSI
jgi:hypothetical protein